MPPLQPKFTVPVPAPTERSSTWPVSAESIATNTSVALTWCFRMSLSPPSFVSPTSAFTYFTPSFLGRAKV